MIKFICWDFIYDFLHQVSNTKVFSELRISEQIQYGVAGKRTRLREVTKSIRIQLLNLCTGDTATAQTWHLESPLEGVVLELQAGLG